MFAPKRPFHGKLAYRQYDDKEGNYRQDIFAENFLHWTLAHFQSRPASVVGTMRDTPVQKNVQIEKRAELQISAEPANHIEHIRIKIAAEHVKHDRISSKIAELKISRTGKT